MAQPSKLSPADEQLLRTHPMFAEVPGGMFDGILKSSRILSLEKNAVIFHAGETAASFYLIANGVIRLFRSDADGAEATVNLFHAGQSFGEAAMFLERAYPVSAQAVGPVRLIRINAENIFRSIRDEPRLAFGLLASMSVHLKLLVDEITLLRTPTAQLRLAEFLLRLSPAEQGPAHITLPYTKVNIAKRLGITPEALSRAFADLKNHGVAADRSTVDVKDVAKLRALFE